jgi:hypothetical protein
VLERSRRSTCTLSLLPLILDHENTLLGADIHQGDHIRDDLRKLGPVLVRTFDGRTTTATAVASGNITPDYPVALLELDTDVRLVDVVQQRALDGERAERLLDPCELLVCLVLVLVRDVAQLGQPLAWYPHVGRYSPLELVEDLDQVRVACLGVVVRSWCG